VSNCQKQHHRPLYLVYLIDARAPDAEHLERLCGSAWQAR
jgi:hypothetical protein